MKKSKRILTVIVILCLATTTAFGASATGGIKSAGTPSEIYELVSNNMEHNFVKISCSGSYLNIYSETPFDYARYGINYRQVEPNQDTSSTFVKWAYSTNAGDYYKFSESINTGSMPDGNYVLIISMDRGMKPNPTFYKNVCFKVSSGAVSILQYDKIVSQNSKIRKAANKNKTSKYKSKKMGDIKSIAFRNPKTKKVAAVTDEKAAYFKKVADKITEEAETDYDKVLKIYEYVAGSFYYDNIAFQTKTNQFVDPYKNIYNQQNNKKSTNSTSDGKVATTCVGYAAMVVALSRAEGIPARVINGHHIGLSGVYNNWNTEEKITLMDHWWAEVYVDGHWIIVDATPGSSNKYDSKAGTWTYTGLTNYVYFDPTPEQFAQQHESFALAGTYK